MVLLSGKEAHGVLISVRCEKVCMLLPQKSPGGTLKKHMLLIMLHLPRLSCVCMTALIHALHVYQGAGGGGGGRGEGVGVRLHKQARAHCKCTSCLVSTAGIPHKQVLNRH